MPTLPKSGLGQLFRRLWKNSRGNVTAVVAISILPMVSVIGGGIDFGNVVMARARLQDAADSGAIAAALETTGTLSNQKVAADSAFASNIDDSSLKGTGAIGALSITTENNIQMMNYAASATVKPYLLGLVGIDTIPISALAKTGVTINSAEIAFVLDNTGSMAQNSKMTSLKSSLDSVLASLVDSSGSSGRTKVALVPFDTQVALSNVAGMTGYVGDFSAVSQTYTCATLSGSQCAAILSNSTSLCQSLASSYGTSAGTTCTANTDSYIKVSGGYYYVYTTSYINNPYYNTNCGYYCYNGYRYIAYYRVAAYSLSGSSATQSGGSSSGGYYSSSTDGVTPNYVGYSNYVEYTGAITYAYPTAGGFSSGATAVFKDNDTITANSDLLGVGTQNWSGCVIDRAQPYDVQSDAPSAGTVATLYPAAKCATNSLLPIMDLTTDIASARTYAQKMTPAGNTNITIGIQWGMEVLSPSAPFTSGAAFTDTTINKYMIILTDGLNTQNRWSTKASDIDARTALACAAAKKLNITVFTVRLEQGNSDMLQACASQTGYYYNLSNASQINGALGGIMKSIKKVRLVK